MFKLRDRQMQFNWVLASDIDSRRRVVRFSGIAGEGEARNLYAE